jgi:hypothetical protein
MNLDRVAIVGTAESWRQTPWADAGLSIISLNDAYQIDGFQRADEWVDMHPLDKFFYPPETPGGKTMVFAHQVPLGYYVRPSKHLDWLATQTMPVWLHPEHATQVPASATWPQARAFPKAAIEAHFGRYFTSTPAWMLAHAILRGAREIHIYGIHLSTQSEYIDQRPNFEFLIGTVLGRGKRTVTVADKLRRYASPEGMVVLPESSPILQSDFQYAFEPSPRRKLDPLKWELHKATIKRERTVDALKRAAWCAPWTRVEEPIPNHPEGKTQKVWKRTSTLQQELWHYDALVADCQETLSRVQAGV